MDEALPLLGRLRRERVPRQARDQVGGELDRVDELSLGRAGMGRAAANRHRHPRRVERLRLDLAQFGAVERVGVAGAEALDVEMVSAARDLLVDREADADRCVLELRMPFQIGDRGHDLRHTGLVVGAEQCRPVGGDDVVTDLLLQQRELFGVEDDARVAREPDRAAVVTLVHLRVDVRPGDVGRGVDVRDQPDRRRRVGALKRAVDVAELVEPDVVEPDLVELVAEQPGEVELLLGRRRAVDPVRRLRIDADVAEQAVEHVIRQFGGERRHELGSRRGRQGGCRAP